MFKDFNKENEITNVELQDIALRHLNGIFVPENVTSDENVSNETFATVLKKFEGYGYTFDKELAKTLYALNTEKLKKISDVFLEVVRKFKSDNAYTVFYRNFPEEVMNLSEMETYFLQFLHYLIGYLPEGAEVNESEESIETEPSEFVKLSHLKRVNETEMFDLLKNLLSSNVTLSETNLKDVLTLLKYCDEKEIKELIRQIKMKETLMRIAKVQFEETGSTYAEFSTATDVLRFIALLSGEKLNPRFIAFKYFKRPELNILISKLENVNYLLDDMKRYRKPWRKFFLMNGNRISFEKYPKVKQAADMLFGKFSHITKKGKFELSRNRMNEMSDTEFEEFLASFSKYSGDYIRNLLSLVNRISEERAEKVLKYFLDAAKEANTRLLFQVCDRILNVKSGEAGRVVNAKNNWLVLEETIKLSDAVLQKTAEAVNYAILEKLSEKEPLGKVWIDESYQNIAMTTSEKDSNSSLRPLTRGSVIPYSSEVDTLRFFVAWKNFKGNRVDLDLSAVKFDADFNHLGEIAYYSHNQKGMAFSGDITDAPQGALEYIDIFDIEKVKEDGTRYVLMTVRSYNGYTYKEMGTAYAGVLELSKKEAKDKKNLYSSAVRHGFALSSNTQTVNTIIVDLEKSEYIWLDMNLPTNLKRKESNYLTNAQIASLKDLLNYFVKKEKVSMYQLLMLNAIARGEVAENVEDADVVFKKIDEDNVLALADILANYL
jgi:hypothetical protein